MLTKTLYPKHTSQYSRILNPLRMSRFSKTNQIWKRNIPNVLGNKLSILFHRKEALTSTKRDTFLTVTVIMASENFAQGTGNNTLEDWNESGHLERNHRVFSCTPSFIEKASLLIHSEDRFHWQEMKWSARITCSYYHGRACSEDHRPIVNTFGGFTFLIYKM